MSGDSTKNIGPVIASEKEVVAEMIDIYCSKKHGTKRGELCDDCAELLKYAHERLDNCRYGEDKPTCRKCPTHCYRPSMRKKMKAVMRVAGPRLFFRAPIKWIRHEIKDRRKRKSMRTK
ncbi:MAG: nitrous oxide-stimulated promoter family protein [Candidatus Thorarchaeota archaeon]|nr:nitrous oxide-stimulated promoter family protein [Candidatus Thorarchaeota archaeon]